MMIDLMFSIRSTPWYRSDQTNPILSIKPTPCYRSNQSNGIDQINPMLAIRSPPSFLSDQLHVIYHTHIIVQTDDMFSTRSIPYLSSPPRVLYRYVILATVPVLTVYRSRSPADPSRCGVADREERPTPRVVVVQTTRPHHSVRYPHLRNER